MKSDAWLTYLDEFMNEYYKELPKHKTYSEAYEEIERPTPGTSTSLSDSLDELDRLQKSKDSDQRSGGVSGSSK
jgi:hypothetical protein